MDNNDDIIVALVLKKPLTHEQQQRLETIVQVTKCTKRTSFDQGSITRCILLASHTGKHAGFSRNELIHWGSNE